MQAEIDPASAATGSGALIAFPLALTLSRLVLGPVVIWAALHGAARGWFALILIAALLSDYFDGAVARRLGVARPWLRRLDSMVDIVFNVCVAAAAFVLEPATMRAGVSAIALLIGSELVCIAVSLIRFRSLPGTHCYSAKLYGLVLFVISLGVLCFGWGPWSLWVLFAFGLAANAECLAVLLRADEAPVDVPGVLARLRARDAGERASVASSRSRA